MEFSNCRAKMSSGIDGDDTMLYQKTKRKTKICFNRFRSFDENKRTRIRSGLGRWRKLTAEQRGKKYDLIFLNGKDSPNERRDMRSKHQKWKNLNPSPKKKISKYSETENR